MIGDVVHVIMKWLLRLFRFLLWLASRAEQAERGVRGLRLLMAEVTRTWRALRQFQAEVKRTWRYRHPEYYRDPEHYPPPGLRKAAPGLCRKPARAAAARASKRLGWRLKLAERLWERRLLGYYHYRRYDALRRKLLAPPPAPPH